MLGTAPLRISQEVQAQLAELYPRKRAHVDRNPNRLVKAPPVVLEAIDVMVRQLGSSDWDITLPTDLDPRIQKMITVEGVNPTTGVHERRSHCPQDIRGILANYCINVLCQPAKQES